MVWRNLLRLTFHDQLPESLWPDGGERWIAVVANLLRQPDSQWWDDADTDGVRRGPRHDPRPRRCGQARDELTRRSRGQPEALDLGPPAPPRPGEPVARARASVGLVRALFNRGPFEVGGGSASVDATSWDAAEGYDVTSAPSMRMVVDLDDLDRSRWVNLTGASGPRRPRRTTATRPSCGSTGGRCRGRSPATRCGGRPRTGWCSSRAD